MKKFITLLIVFCSLAMGSAIAQRTVTGVVSDVNGEPLIGATVLVQGTAIGTVTDIEGRYSIQVPADRNTLTFSYTGFRTANVELGASNVQNVVLDEEAAQLSEVVVVGYGTQIKSTLTGNIAKVKGEDIEFLPVPSVEQALQGRTAGVFIESVNGKPGGAVRVRVRGASSISASNQPLYVIDGIPVTVESQNLSGAPLNPLADLNFNDVESIEILKDASAGAIYGSRAANGVVLITTKRGRSGRTNVELNLQSGFSEPSRRREFLNTEEYIELFQRAAAGAGRYEWREFPEDWDSEQEAIDWWTGFTEGRFTRYSGHADWRAREMDTNWENEAMRRGQNRLASLSLSGGNERTRFFASGGYNYTDGILIGNNFERMSGRLNLDQTVSNRFSFGTNLSLSRTFTDQVSTDNAFSTPMQLVALAPLTPLRNTTNQVVAGTQPGQLYDRPTATYYNGLIELEDAQREVNTFRTLGNAYGRFEIARGLYLNGDIGVDVFNLKDNAFWGRRTFTGQGVDGFGSSRFSQVVNITSKLFANYNRTLGLLHNIDLTGGIEFQRSRTDRTTVEGQNFPVDDLKTLASAAEITFGSSILDEFSFLSYFGRFTYDFNRKYLLTLSGRVDGSSRFGANNRYGFFPAVSAGWVLTEEPFLRDKSGLSFLKLRASYGLTGNAEIGNFDHLGLFNAASYNNQAALTPFRIPNPDLTWENTAQVDIGFDFGFFNNRLTGEIDYYNKRTTDMLLNVPVPGTSGFGTQTRNVGSVENKGFELVLNANVLTGAFKWTTGFNIARNDNKVLELAEGQDIIDPGSARFMNVVKVGHPIGAFFGAEYAGVDPANGDALWYVNKEGRERQTTNNFNDADFVVLGSPIPTWVGGFNNRFSFKGFTLDILFQGVQGNMIHNAAGGFMSCNACWFDNQTRDQMNYWNQPGDITNVPEPRLGFSNGDQSRSGRYMSDGSYIRLRTLTFGYELPRNLISNIGLSRLRAFINGQNLLLFTKYDGWDPEVSSDAFVSNILSGVDFYAAPQPRTITFGLNVGF
jgi:TonB-linked SusC/RagA family outer membrane protein